MGGGSKTLSDCVFPIYQEKINRPFDRRIKLSKNDWRLCFAFPKAGRHLVRRRRRRWKVTPSK